MSSIGGIRHMVLANKEGDIMRGLAKPWILILARAVTSLSTFLRTRNLPSSLLPARWLIMQKKLMTIQAISITEISLVNTRKTHPQGITLFISIPMAGFGVIPKRYS